MDRYELSVPDMTCGGCEETVENAATSVDGVLAVEADHERGTVEVTGDAPTDAVADAIEDSGFPVEG